MKKLLVTLCVVTLAIGVTGMAYAFPATIDDSTVPFIGGNYASDVIGTGFSIDKLTVDVNAANIMTVKIFTDYVKPAYENTLGTKVGDLFISGTGWKPSGAAPNYTTDTFTGAEVPGSTKNQTQWQYAFDFDTASLYAITNANIKTSTDVYGAYAVAHNYTYRHDIAVDSVGGAFIENGNFSKHASYYELSFDIGNLNLNLNQLAFHWAMTCANDVIEGDPVPEPSTLLLLGAGLLGLVAFGRKHLKK
jgi:hypothetical protein